MAREPGAAIAINTMMSSITRAQTPTISACATRFRMPEDSRAVARSSVKIADGKDATILSGTESVGQQPRRAHQPEGWRQSWPYRTAAGNQSKDDRIVSGKDRVHRQTTEPGPSKHNLDKHGPSHERLDGETRDGEERDERVPECVAQHHSSLGEPLGPCGTDEILVERFDHRGAREAHIDRELQCGECRGREDKVLESRTKILLRP